MVWRFVSKRGGRGVGGRVHNDWIGWGRKGGERPEEGTKRAEFIGTDWDEKGKQEREERDGRVGLIRRG